ncbi:unnamed protein product [Phyllotreta striolata]|uniref:Sema domain-containing protein n=1 Tax=Phyllotreta striolata TaxID=444603 RepID=A0A9N9THW7_PHYSR|nr:unnamed protein product [Phyllotreta striolata]
MIFSAFSCLPTFYQNVLFFTLVYLMRISHAWLPNTSTKLINPSSKIHTVTFRGNTSLSDHFTVLYQDKNSLLLGGRNQIYNLSVFDFSERNNPALFWPSSEAHSQLCNLKGKSEDDCQNYIRIFYSTAPGKYLICGTNSYKPICRILQELNGQLIIEKEMEGIGLCPYDPDHNSTSVYSNGHLFSATVADFSGTDPLIYREPLRTELSDLRQLNAPNFVSSLTYGDYIYFFFRETAVEYMNCGKVIYSRVARVCKRDKGGPHQSHDSWTTFLKARLNCSVPGEYPFYFDEIQSTSALVEGNYGAKDGTARIVYGAFTTPDNAIGGSAICLFDMDEAETVFGGPFKHQEGINSNWLPVPEDKVPKPRPGECVQDSRVLADKHINFVKTHPMMERAVPSLFGRPLLIRVSLHYRFTAVAVDPQVRTVTDETFDVIYVGTDEGKILKVVNVPSANGPPQAVVVSENEVFPRNTAVKQLRIAPGYGRVIAVSSDEVKLVSLNHCANYNKCSDCLELRDPHCAWDSIKSDCVSVDRATTFSYLIQDIRNGSSLKCRGRSFDNAVPDKENGAFPVDGNGLDVEKELSDPLLNLDSGFDECNDVDPAKGCTSQSKLTLYSSNYLVVIVASVAVGFLFVGFTCGYLVGRRFQAHSQFPNQPFIEQHNHLDRLTANQNSFLATKTKTVNLDVLNVSSDSLPPKKDNLGSLKNLNIANEGTLQKIKKTYI